MKLQSMKVGQKATVTASDNMTPEEIKMALKAGMKLDPGKTSTTKHETLNGKSYRLKIVKKGLKFIFELGDDDTGDTLHKSKFKTMEEAVAKAGLVKKTIRMSGPEALKAKHPSTAAQIDATASNSNDKVIQDIRTLSSGTIATLTGVKKMHDIELIQLAFENFTANMGDKGIKFSRWQDAFAGMMKHLDIPMLGGKVDMNPADFLEAFYGKKIQGNAEVVTADRSDVAKAFDGATKALAKLFSAAKELKDKKLADKILDMSSELDKSAKKFMKG